MWNVSSLCDTASFILNVQLRVELGAVRMSDILILIKFLIKGQ